MHFFDSMRRYSRNGTTTTKERTGHSTPPPPLPPSPIMSTAPRQPLVPQTNLTLTASRTSNNSATASTGSSSKNSGYKVGRNRPEDGDNTKASPSKAATRSERSNTLGSGPDGSMPHRPTTVLASSQRSTYTSHPDLYTHNSLNSFSFGAASVNPPPSRAIDPLSPSRDDDSDEYPYKADTTPRPSLVAASSPRSHSSQLPPMPSQFPASLPPPPRRSPAKLLDQRPRKISTSSAHTFGTSSASASASSLSSAAMEFSTVSRRGGSTTTPQTSANELTSEDDEEEHRHPIPPLPPTSSGVQHMDSGSLYGSDDDQFDEDFDDEREPYDVDVSSVLNEETGEGVYYDDYRSSSRESFRSAFAPRRGSLAVPIPSPNSMEGRDREDSIATLRRPSRSLEGLRSDSRAASEAASVRFSDSHYLAPAPTSVPESDIRRRSIEQGREQAARTLTTPSLVLTSASSTVGSTADQDAQSTSTAVHNSVLDGFDDSWNIDPTTGIVDLCASEMADIVGNFGGPRSSDRSFRRGSSSTTDSGRRLSTTSTNSDPFARELNKWGGQQYKDEKMKWTFVREKADRLKEHRATVERDRHSISALFNHKSSSSHASSSMGSSSTGFHEYGNYTKEGERYSVREPTKSKDPQQPWRGMALGAEEWWSSYSNGRYKVTRQSQQKDPDKPPQQRVNVSHHRTPYSHKRDMSDGPSSTIHKHSKAICFSISRHYRIKDKAPLPGSMSSRASTSSRTMAGPSHNVDDKKSSNMVMLATRRVHEKFTSTNTTRKLESHGLLSESGRQSPRDIQRLERLERENNDRRRKEKEKEKEREKQRLKKEREALKAKDKGKGKGGSRVASSSESSAGSVAHDVKMNTPAAGPSNPRPSVDQSVVSHETTNSDRTVVWSGSHNWRDHVADDYEEDDEDDDVYPPLRRRAARQTPHIEAYSTLAPETLESFTQPVKAASIFGWSKSKGTSQLPPHEMKSYIPPWPVAQQTRHHGDRKGIVEDLNSSFQDVGLLPAVGEIKNSGSVPRRKGQPRTDRHQNSSSQDIPNVFHSFPSDFLFMLLPLWPGETDPLSAKKYPFTAPVVPLEARKFLLLYYKPDESSGDGDKGRGAKDGKKRSPTSSRDSVAKGSNDKHILLHKFHFCARIVTYADIQGSGVRSPDVGLSVIGPLAEAVETMPTRSYIDTFQVIGMCNSREKGIEFIPEGLEKLGLTKRVPDPTAREEPEPVKRFSITGMEEPDEVSDTMLVLTPIGRAVVEMAWLGSMALTSFAAT